MQPLAEVTLNRPWHWGIAVLGDAFAEVPTDLVEGVATGRDVITLGVRHAQDIDAERFEGDWDWATATFHVRTLVEEEATDRKIVCEATIATPDETVSLGDADGMLVIPAPASVTRVIVSADEVPATGLETIWIDLVPAEG